MKQRIAICIAAFFVSLPIVSAVERFGATAVIWIGSVAFAGAWVGVLLSFYGKRPDRPHVTHERELFGKPMPPMPSTRAEQVEELEQLFESRYGER